MAELFDVQPELCAALTHSCWICCLSDLVLRFLHFLDGPLDTFHVRNLPEERAHSLGLFWINTEPDLLQVLLYSITVIGRSLGVQACCHSPPLTSLLDVYRSWKIST